MKILWSRYNYHPHYREEESEAQKCEVFIDSHTEEVAVPEFEPGTTWLHS